MKCPKCNYRWEPRVANPRRCPRCGKWLIPKPVHGPAPKKLSEFFPTTKYLRGMPMVRTSDGYLVPWTDNAIINQLVRETKLAHEIFNVPPIGKRDATEIAREARERINDMRPKFVSGPLIREVVNNILIEWSSTHPEYQIYRNILTRVGTPVFDAYEIDVGRGWEAKENANLQPNPETAHKKKADRLSKEEYLLLMNPRLSTAHAQGDIHIHDLEYFGTRPFCQDWDLRYFLYYGLLPDGMGFKSSVAGPAKHPEVALLHSVKVLAAAQTNFSGGQGFMYYTVFLAPFMRGLPYERIKQLAQMMFYELTQTYVTRGGQLVFSNIQLPMGVPDIWKDKPIVVHGRVGPDVYGDYEDEVQSLFRAINEVALEGDYWGKPFNFPKMEEYVSPEFFRSEYDDLWLLVHKSIAKFGSPYLDNMFPAYRGFGKGVSCYQCVPADERVIAEVDGKLVIDRIENIHRETLTKPIKAYGFNPKTMKVGFYPAKMVMQKLYNGKLYAILLETGRRITVTADHPCYVFRNGELCLKKASELRVGDYLPVLKEMPINKETIELNLRQMFIEAKVERIVIRNGRINVPYAKKRGIPAKISVTPELGRLIGYYLAEGDANPGCFAIRFSFDKNEKHLIDDVQNCLKSVFGLTGNVYELKTAKVLQVGSKPLFHFFIDVLKMGHNSDTKNVPNIVYTFPKETIAQVLLAFLYGDGNVDTRKRQTQIRLAHQSSKYLVQGIILLGLRMGIPMNYSEGHGHFEAKITSRELVERFVHVTHLQKQLQHETPKTSRSFVYDVYPLRQLAIKASELAYSQLMSGERVGSQLLTIEKDSFAYDVANSAIHPVKVVSITEKDCESIMVYDFVDVEGAYTFSNSLGVLTHNCCAYNFVSTPEIDEQFNQKMHFEDGAHFSLGGWQVISINMPRLAYRAGGDYDKLRSEAYRCMDLAVEAFKMKDRWMKIMLKNARIPFAVQRPRDPRTGRKAPPVVDFDELIYAIGVIGINEMVQHFTGHQLHEDEDAIRVALKLLIDMEKYRQELESKNGVRVRLARTPAESSAQRLAIADLCSPDFRNMAKDTVKGDLKRARELIGAGRRRDAPIYYTNGTHSYVKARLPLAKKINIEHKFFPLLSGGNIFHVWLGETYPDAEALFKLTKRIVNQTQIGYFAYTKDMTICGACNKTSFGLVKRCPHCRSSSVRWWSRITGYYSDVTGWNEGKKAELLDRYRIAV